MSNTVAGSASRKRAAPGASPAVPLQQSMPQQFSIAHGGADQLMRWNANDDGAAHASAGLSMPQAQPQFAQGIPTHSSALTRRQPNHALVQTHRQNFDQPVEGWPNFGDEGALLATNNGGESNAQDNVELLEEMAQKVKRDAQGKRKSIPPFVQKLSSFLEEGKNEELIRWSEKGDSFIVLDEDEFAKTLIPELFKHNKYASFVRQLNMYGFHKRVGLSDNSMRASERKNKSPSEYSNPYFRRGHPNLLWLINKPASGNKAKKGGKNTEGDGDSEEEVVGEEPSLPGPSAANMSTGRSLPPAESQPIQQKDIISLRGELKTVRDQQKYILGAINQLQRNNNNLYNQALMFQNQHDRHQNSINAILTFLANVFRKTLEDQGNNQSVSDIISSMISNQGQQQQSQQGSVVDLGDYLQSTLDPSTSLGGYQRRAVGLLPPIPSTDPQASSGRATPLHTGGYHPMRNQNHQTGHITELVDPLPNEAPPNLRHELETNPHERMMKIIHDHNATNTTGLDLPEAADLVANTPSALSQDQRSDLANIMASQPHSKSASPPAPSMSASPPNTMPNMPATSSLSPPRADSAAPPSLSPILRSPQLAPPSLHQISADQADIDMLQRMQAEQDSKINELGSMLNPYSPSSRIPEFDADPNNAYLGNADLDNFINTDFLQDGDFANNGYDFLDLGNEDPLNVAQPLNGGITNDTPSPTGTEEILRNDLGDEVKRDTKRQRKA